MCILVNLELARRKIDHAIGDDRINRAVTSRQMFDLTQAELQVLVISGYGIFPGFRDHFGRHIDADYFSGGADYLRG
jgi:hypothetical protein